MQCWHDRPASSLYEYDKLSGQAVAGKRGARDGDQAPMVDTIDHVQEPEPPAIGHLVMDKVYRPAGIRPCLQEDGYPDSNGSLAALALANPSLFLTVEALDVRGLAIP